MSIKYQSHPKLIKIDAFEQKICICHNNIHKYNDKYSLFPSVCNIII